MCCNTHILWYLTCSLFNYSRIQIPAIRKGTFVENQCVDCGKRQKRYRCESCMAIMLLGQKQPADMNRTIAHAWKLREYFANCPKHGLVLHRGDTDVCLLCVPRRPNSARAIARRSGHRVFEKECPLHGVVDHDVNSGKCRTCVPLVVGPRGPQTPARAQARHDGRRTFRAYCVVHVEAEHYVTSGKCSQCYTTAGAVRGTPVVRSVTPRAAARRAGSVTYEAPCEIHGPAATHHVNTGRCLACFTATGSRRVRAG